MKVTIACLNSKYIHMSSAPWCLAAGVAAFAETAVTARVMESTINADLTAFAEEIIAQKPDVLSFSCYIWNVTQTLAVAKDVKAATDCTVVLGGPEVAYCPKEILRQYPFVDYVLGGEGEFTFPQFLEMIGGERAKEETEALSYRTADGTVTTPDLPHCETPPSPFSEEYFAALGGRIAYIESSRGCPYRCAFCLSGRVSPLRFFDLKQVERDLLRLAGSGTRTIKFVDRTFNASESHCNAVLSFILKHYGREIPEGVCFHFEIAGDVLRESTMELLARFPKGAVQLEIGMQSFNENTLAALHRKTDTERLTKNIRRLVAMGNMHIHIDLIAGLTGEDIKSFERSFNIGFSLGAQMLQMGFLKLLHGAEMREHPALFPCTYSAHPPYEVTSTPWLSFEEITALKKTEDALERLYNSGRFLWTVEYLLKETGLSPFALFYKIGQSIEGKEMSAGEYAEKLFLLFGGEGLREAMLCDLLISGLWTQVPPRFKRPHPAYKQVKRALCAEGNVKLTILSDGQVVAADYAASKDLRGRLPHKKYRIDFEGQNVYNIKEI